MRTRTALFFLVAFVFGIAAVFLARQWLQTQRLQTAANVPVSKVVIATADLSLGDRITAEQVKEVDWPANNIPAGAFMTTAQLLATNPVVVRRFYAQLLHRVAPPSNAEVDFFVNSGQDVLSIAVQFAASPEFQANG